MLTNDMSIKNKYPTRLIRADEIAEILQISLSFAYRLMQRGDIKTVRLGRAVRVKFEDLDEFIERNRSAYNSQQW